MRPFAGKVIFVENQSSILMTTKRYFFPLLACVLLLSSAFMCQKDDDGTAPSENPHFTSLVGYWKVVHGQTFAKNEAGATIVTANLNPGAFAHEFFANGAYKGHVLVGKLTTESGNWMLTVRKTEGADIEDGTLAIKTASTVAEAGNLFVDADGYQRFTISSLNSVTGSGKSRIYLISKRYAGYPYAENWAEYAFEKQ